MPCSTNIFQKTPAHSFTKWCSICKGTFWPLLSNQTVELKLSYYCHKMRAYSNFPWFIILNNDEVFGKLFVTSSISQTNLHFWALLKLLSFVELITRSTLTFANVTQHSFSNFKIHDHSINPHLIFIISHIPMMQIKSFTQ